MFGRFNGSSWKIFNHSNPQSGASSRLLEIIFTMWLLPILEYWSVWIFRIKKCFHYSYTILSTYKTVFEHLETLYCRIAILGIDKSTNNKATLIRIRWIPLDYRLAFQVYCWYICENPTRSRRCCFEKVNTSACPVLGVMNYGQILVSTGMAII